MKLYGTTTSPFVRRVRVVATEVGEPIDMIDTAPEAGQARLREVSPIRKVPVAVIDGRTIYDSRVIIDWLTTTRGWGTIVPPVDRWREQNLLNAIDGVLDSISPLFYLKRDGIPAEGTPYAERQLVRAEAIFGWLGTELGADRWSFSTGFGLAELSLICALDWMDFRQTFPLAKLAALAPLRDYWRERASLAATRPHA
jgi:glutathione S-transferase